MSNCNWEIIEEFQSPGEYKRFCSWLAEYVNNGEVEQTKVNNYYVNSYFKEEWFRCKKSGEIWRLVAPQDPFHGYWGPVLD